MQTGRECSTIPPLETRIPMATARSSQAHQKRVQKIAEDAASAIADASPVEEEVTVVVEETPIDDSAPATRRRGTQAAGAGVAPMAGMAEMVAQTRQALAGSIKIGRAHV